MIFENYSYILTSKGFKDVRDLINSKDTSIAYIDNCGKLSFTNEYIIEKDIPRVISDYTDDLFLSFISDSDAEFYSEAITMLDSVNLIKTNLHNAKNVLVSYDCFKDIDVVDIRTTIQLSDNVSIPISYKDLIKLFILYCCFGSSETLSDSQSVKLYTNYKPDHRNISLILAKILGEDNFRFYRGKSKTTFYIDSKYLYNYFTDKKSRDNMLENMLNSSKIKNSAYLVCQAILELSDELCYYDSNHIGLNVLFGCRNMIYASSYLQACLAVCGYKSYFRRQFDGKFKLMFTKQNEHYFIDNVKYSDNKCQLPYYKIKTKERLPIFILEIRNYLNNISIRPTFSLEDRNVDFSCSYNILGDD